MKAIAVLEPGKVGVVEIPAPEPGPYQALVRNEVAYLCNATDRKLVEGHFPGMGAELYPLILGHETAGRVVAVGSKVRSYAAGDLVVGALLLDTGSPRYGSGWGGDSEYLIASDAAAMIADGVADAAHGWDDVFKIMRTAPADIGPEAAGLLCTWREVYAAFADFKLRSGDDVLIFGAGPVGLSFCAFAKLLGLGWVGVVAKTEEKRELARRFGADAVFSPDDPAIAALPASRGKGMDAVIDAVGSPAVINAALGLLRLAGTVCVYGVLSDPVLALDKSKGPYNFNLLVHQWPTRDGEAAAQEPLIEWLRAGKLKASDFITARFGFEDIEKALAASRAPGAVKTLLDFRPRT